MDLPAFAEASSKFAADTEDYITKINGYIGYLQGLRAQLMTGVVPAFSLPPRKQFPVDTSWAEFPEKRPFPEKQAYLPSDLTRGNGTPTQELTVTGPQPAVTE